MCAKTCNSEVEGKNYFILVIHIIFWISQILSSWVGKILNVLRKGLSFSGSSLEFFQPWVFFRNVQKKPDYIARSNPLMLLFSANRKFCHWKCWVHCAVIKTRIKVVKTICVEAVSSLDAAFLFPISFNSKNNPSKRSRLQYLELCIGWDNTWENIKAALWVLTYSLHRKMCSH